MEIDVADHFRQVIWFAIHHPVASGLIIGLILVVAWTIYLSVREKKNGRAD